MKRRVFDYGTDIRRVIPSASVSNGSTGILLVVDVDGPVTFDQLAELSVLLGTKNINVCSEYRGDGCSTCGNGGGQARWLEIADVTR
jgi:hypothetical protein